MAIETYVSSSPVVGNRTSYVSCLNDILGQAGFTAKVEFLNDQPRISSGAIFDHTFTNSHSLLLEGAPSKNGATTAYYGFRLVAVVDKDRKILYVGGQNIMGGNTPDIHDAGCLFLMIFDGDYYLCHNSKNATGSENKTILTNYNLPFGYINQTQENALAPLWCNYRSDWSTGVTGVWQSYQTNFYTSLTLKNETCGTVVSDGTHTFTSCGNMIYIKNAS